MAQILSIYGLVASVIISGDIIEKMPLHQGFMELGAGISVGLCGLAAGFAIGIVGDAGGDLRFSSPQLFRMNTIADQLHQKSERARSNPDST
jgi:V-type H+-transporting ATPase proteolipid subunit